MQFSPVVFVLGLAVAVQASYYGNSTAPPAVASTGIIPPSAVASTSPTTSPGFTSNAGPLKEVGFGAVAVAGLAAMFL